MPLLLALILAVGMKLIMTPTRTAISGRRARFLIIYMPPGAGLSNCVFGANGTSRYQGQNAVA